ncbi:protein adenylyltransferase SelO [Psychrobacter sp. FDAARGOS_221]|uniref:protein adenylyltransferase SelO n=1 Tax=Psychrobacter sp. FDAARGOS_221 TaxID=1975705 RepID=UPI000BB537DB|nr:YdiU family protein [Psychrobacter sp. FDAARGOS_221]PNK59513.1 YdiU family protein [Psychrobacter sp. FDAARGOS_221]
MNFENSYATLDSRLYNKQPPVPLKNARAGHFNPIVAGQLGWDEDPDLMQHWVQILAGEEVPKGFEPLAMAYAGHQFGQWAGQLGDGRGLLMAQVRDKQGQLTDLHLKGAGLTPYSRMGDGRAVLRSTIREYLCGHAMTSLGVRSSSSLGFVTSDTPVRRESIEPGAALMRVADTHIRLGHVEWIASFAPDLLGGFTKYMIETYYPELTNSQTPVADFISAVVSRTATMIADWQLIGFAHGVMNTDNLSITGTTLDYGPFGFLERFDPAWINNHSDYTGRYSYQNQPAIGHWNLNVWMLHFMQLSGKTVIGDTQEDISRDTLAQCLAHYETDFMRHYQQGICRKMGLPWEGLVEADNNLDTNANANKTDSDKQLNVDDINATLKLSFEFLQFVEDNKLDYTNSFRALIAVLDADNHPHEAQLLQHMNDELDDEQRVLWQQWQDRYVAHVNQQLIGSGYSVSQPADLSPVINILQSTNPAYVLRNAMAQKAITQAESGDFSEVDRLFKLLTTPYQVQPIATEAYTTPPAADAKPLVISCSS